MRYISSAEIRSNPALLWKEDEEPETIITVNGRPRVIALSIDGDPEGILHLIRRIRAERSLEQMWLTSEMAGTSHMTMEEINAEIADARKKSQS
ncbi:MAG: hypothetical protein JXA44_10880 [Methanospirillaceae archaeon]|nr:hypothetical protein [Methanospirillaceae archaeon]